MYIKYVKYMIKFYVSCVKSRREVVKTELPEYVKVIKSK